MFRKTGTNERRYRLNRLAETLVTTERYAPPWWETTFLVFDEMDAVHPALNYVNALVHSDAPISLYGGRSSYNLADTAEALGMSYGKIPTGPTEGEFEVDLVAECPYGNPGCMLPDAPIGHGLHKPCVEDAERRDRAMRESMPRITSAEANAEIAAMIEEATR